MDNNNNNNNNNLINEYNTKLNEFVNHIPNHHYILEVTKLCGHGQFIIVHKNQSLLDLYKTVAIYYDCNDIKELFFINNITNEKIKLSLTDKTTIRDFIIQNNSGSNLVINPIYPIPCKIVYKLYFDDGHTHGEQLCSQIST